MGLRRYAVLLIALAAMLALPQAASALKFTPASGSPLTASGDPITMSAIADFDGDGVDDIAFSSTTSPDPSQIHVKLNDGNGDFTDATGSPFTVSGSYQSAIRAADFDGDGNADLLIGSYLSWNVMLGTGDGQFSPTPDSTVTLPPAMPNSRGAADNFANTIGDVDKDGDLDLVFGMFETGIDVVLNDGHANFTALPVIYLVPETDRAANGFDGMFSPKLGDFNADGKTDIAAGLDSVSAPSSTPTGVYVAYGNGAGGFTPASGPPLFSGLPQIKSLSSLRLFAGATDDVAVAASPLPDGTNFFTALGGNSGLTVNPSPLGKLNAGYGPYEQATADLDGDGWTDIVVGARGDYQLALLRNIGDGSIMPSFGPPVDLPQVDGNNFSVNGVYTGDFNGDGATDIAADSSHSGQTFQARGIDVLLSRPNVMVVANEIDFGTVPTGSSSPWTNSLTNDGAAPATFSDPPQISGPGADQFRIGTTDCGDQLDGSSSCLFDVIFAPRSEGDQQATLRLSPDGQDAIEIHLTGSGGPPDIVPAAPKLSLKLAGAKKVKRGKTLVLRAKTGVSGDTSVSGVTLKVKLPPKLAKRVKPIRIGDLEAGQKVTRKIRIKVRKKARKGRKLKVTVSASGSGVKMVTARRSARIK